MMLLLHGNTASSRMFEPLLTLYKNKFHVILMDFLGHGKSERLGKFPADLWLEESRQVVALLEHLKLGRVSLVGTSGGAWVAINAALERPDLVEKVVADSFDGRTLEHGLRQVIIGRGDVAGRICVDLKNNPEEIQEPDGSREKSGKNRWLHPDIVGVHFPFDFYMDNILKLFDVLKVNPYKRYSFEMKISLSLSNLRECCFQAVSNSSRAS